MKMMCDGCGWTESPIMEQGMHKVGTKWDSFTQQRYDFVDVYKEYCQACVSARCAERIDNDKAK